MKVGCTEKAQRKDMPLHVDNCLFALKAEIERLKKEKETESVEKENWKRKVSLCSLYLKLMFVVVFIHPFKVSFSASKEANSGPSGTAPVYAI